MTTLKQGDLIRSDYGTTRIVMEVYGTVLHISRHEDHNRFDFTTDEETLKDKGFTWDTPAWEPSKGGLYWFITINMGIGIGSSFWGDDEYDQFRRDFLGIYQTKELAEAAVLEIRRKLGK